MPAGIEDVAHAAGVSTATVSRALRGLPNVSEPTRLSVLKAAADLGYVISRSASRLATGRTLAVAVVSPFMERWFFGQAIAAIESELRNSGFDALLIGLHDPNHGRRAPFDPGQLRGRVDGIVILTSPLTDEEIDGVLRLGLPTVYVGATVDGAPSVGIDDGHVARLATQHLLDLGHTRIAYVGGDPEQALNQSVPAARRAGWAATLQAAGIVPDTRYEVPGLFTPTGGRAAGDRLLSLADPPTAVFVASDEMAFGVIAAARARGLRVPEDLSVIGVDGHELAAVLGLTTVEQPVAAQGARAARWVLEAVQGATAPSTEQVLLPVSLTVRNSTVAVRARDAQGPRHRYRIVTPGRRS